METVAERTTETTGGPTGEAIEATLVAESDVIEKALKNIVAEVVHGTDSLFSYIDSDYRDRDRDHEYRGRDRERERERDYPRERDYDRERDYERDRPRYNPEHRSPSRSPPPKRSSPEYR